MPTALVTAPPDVAAELAETLVDERLAACMNRVECRSTYRWDGTVHDDTEVLLLAKTTHAAYPALADAVREQHPYDTPCVERFDESEIDDAFAAWRSDAVDDP
jgi:periplasmic divalent cation tolerance protein